MKRLLPLFTTLVFFGAGGTGASQALAASAPEPMHRVVFDLTSPQPATWTALMNNAENLQKRFGEAHTELEVVCHGPGLAFLLRSNKPAEARMASLAKRHMVFAACHNTMNAMQVTQDELFPFAKVVPSGVGELVLKQEAGWSYLKTVL
jgi:intracellular sulfur oxidation DsrE/DsrF family protein